MNRKDKAVESKMIDTRPLHHRVGSGVRGSLDKPAFRTKCPAKSQLKGSRSGA